jgi:hypothetical protein
MKILGKAIDMEQPAESDRVLSISVDFGPKIKSHATTRGDLARTLRATATKHPKSFIGQMMDHFAEHIEAAAKYDPNGKYALSALVSHPMDATYYGQGSCENCGSVNDTCCTCIHDGINSCEPC